MDSQNSTEENNLQTPLNESPIVEQELAFVRIFKSLDFHKKLPTEITQPSYSGAISQLEFSMINLIVSVITFILILLLVIGELNSHSSENIVSQMILEQASHQKRVQVNAYIILPKFPCGLISLDIADTIGQHQINVEGELNKISLDQQGNEMDENQMHSMHASHPHDQSAFISLETIKQQVENRQGCALKGKFFINQVPGNFHISLHAFGGVIQTLQQNNQMPEIDLSHKIVSLSFGDEKNNERIQKKFDHGLMHPLDKTTFSPQEGASGYHYIYFLNIVPTYYKESERKNIESYQFIATKGSYSTDHMPVIIFKYEFAGVSVQYEFEGKPLQHLIVSLCGIIGGIFILAGLLEFFNNKLLCFEFSKKSEPVIGK